jgi:hypothetical protein
MRRYGLVLCGLLLAAASAFAQEPAANREPDVKPFTPAQERAAAEARARQARLRTRHQAGVSIARPTFLLPQITLSEPAYRIDPGMTPRTINVPWLR